MHNIYEVAKNFEIEASIINKAYYYTIKLNVLQR